MRKLLVRDVMTTDVPLAGPGTPFKELVGLIKKDRIDAVVVVDGERHVLGVVTDVDLLPKQAYLGRPLQHAAHRRRRYLRARVRATTAEGLMTSPAIVIDGSASLAAASRLMVRHDIKQLPVVEPDGELIGIVSRTDLITAFLRSDSEIRADVLDQVIAPQVLAPPEDVTVRVHDGVVQLRGRMERRSSVAKVEDLVSHIDGVVRVVNDLDFHHDDYVPPSELYPPRGEAPYYGSRFP